MFCHHSQATHNVECESLQALESTYVKVTFTEASHALGLISLFIATADSHKYAVQQADGMVAVIGRTVLTSSACVYVLPYMNFVNGFGVSLVCLALWSIGRTKWSRLRSV